MVIRPADGNEVSAAYACALLNYDAPTTIALSRQPVPHLAGSSIEAALRGGYTLMEALAAAEEEGGAGTGAGEETAAVTQGEGGGGGGVGGGRSSLLQRTDGGGGIAGSVAAKVGSKPWTDVRDVAVDPGQPPQVPEHGATGVTQAESGTLVFTQPIPVSASTDPTTVTQPAAGPSSSSSASGSGSGSGAPQSTALPDLIIMATGSEVALAVDAAQRIVNSRSPGTRVRVVSLPCAHIFERQSPAYRQAVLPDGVPVLAVEASCELPLSLYYYCVWCCWQNTFHTIMFALGQSASAVRRAPTCF